MEEEMSKRDQKYVMAFDVGTTGCRTFLLDKMGKIAGSSYKEFPQIYPRPGWVEHDPEVIWSTQLEVTRKVMETNKISFDQVDSIGITNQRETTVVWDKNTGKPVMNAIVWQDRRTEEYCQELKAEGCEDYIKENTGLIIDSYFSGTKIRWILDHVEGAREKAKKGDLLFGTIDSWIIWNLSGKKIHVTDYSNASRTLVFNIKCLEWDEYLLETLGIPKTMMPEARQSSEVYGMTDPDAFFGASIPIAGAVGDQQGALFGQTCFDPGMVKATYGTGGSLMMNTGNTPVHSKNGLLTSVAWGMNGEVSYSLEGLLYIVGASVQWLRDELQIIEKSSDTEAMALAVEDNNGVYLIPAFVGLSAPYWDTSARAALLGLTRGANKNHIARAALESIAYQIKDVLICMEEDAGIQPVSLKVDGGVTNNNFVMQFQASLLGVEVMRPKVVDATVRGAAFLAGLATGFWKSKEELIETFEVDRRFQPSIGEEEKSKMAEYYDGWKEAVNCIWQRQTATERKKNG